MPPAAPELKMPPPTEAEGPKLEVIEGGKTHEVSQPVKESWTSKARDIFSSLTDKGKEFAGKLWDKVASSEIVQNITDRYQVWKNDRLSRREEEKSSALETQKNSAEERGKTAHERALKGTQELEALTEKFKSMNTEVSPEVTQKINSEIAQHEQSAQTARTETEQIQNQITELRGTKEQFEGKVKEARDRLDGRLKAKMDLNSETIGRLDASLQQYDSQTAENKLNIAETVKNIQDLAQFAGTVETASVRQALQEQISKLEAAQKKLEETNTKLEKERGKANKEKNKFTERNQKLQAQRDAIFPSKEKQGAESETKTTSAAGETSSGGASSRETRGGETHGLAETVDMEGSKIILNFGGGAERWTLDVKGGKLSKESEPEEADEGFANKETKKLDAVGSDDAALLVRSINATPTRARILEALPQSMQAAIEKKSIIKFAK